VNIPAHRWKPPPVDHYKINVDASFLQGLEDGVFSSGIVKVIFWKGEQEAFLELPALCKLKL
jgi:hypothetical protein